MPAWTHLIRFIAVEDSATHLGQLADPSRDVGLDTVNHVEIKAYLIQGTVFEGQVTEHILTVKQLLSPISKDDCNYIRCLGLNYSDHAKEAGVPLPKAPILFAKPRSALADPYPATINIPKCAQDGSSDYEAELCFVMGKTGRDIPEEEALDYVLGYTASNDVTARALQLSLPQSSFSKGFDGSCPLGPVLVSSDIIKDPQTLSIKAIYDGVVVQDGHTENMVFSVRQQISYLSQGTTLEAGTIFITGTPAGIGYFRNPRVVLEDGGDMRVEISGGIGTLVNKVRYDTT
ncbi:fumarylacetoacetate FAA hydrolase family protein [Coleophoma cylindrospora]|uniref:Fumarylacetoacetate FAA hydrolase family protein n=1 Tax=Coleophoma cylindrospora TaxID=1849047 RepID=A0A3D8RN82_9HELO|nr:fumarylacetoacetate FAA hydrolase family protein [Coleophoma cylindrospora]